MFGLRKLWPGEWVAPAKINGPVKVRPRLCEMEVGDRAYAVPWAYDPTRESLNTNHTAYAERGGTVEMLVERTADGFEITPPDGYEW